jgi:hypothetical protein
MLTAAVILWAGAVILAGLHVLEHRSGGRHDTAWRALPRGLRAGLMLMFFSFVLVAASAWFLFPAVTLALLAAADLAAATHPTRPLKHPS